MNVTASMAVLVSAVQPFITGWYRGSTSSELAVNIGTLSPGSIGLPDLLASPTPAQLSGECAAGDGGGTGCRRRRIDPMSGLNDGRFRREYAFLDQRWE